MYMRNAVLIVVMSMLCWYARGACGATLVWTYPLGAGASVSAVVVDGRGGALLCYFIPASNAVYATYVDKKREPVWHNTYSNCNAVRAKHLSRKQAIITVYEPSGDAEVHEITMKTGADNLLVGGTGWAATADNNVVAANKDRRGFFVVKRELPSGTTYVLRLSYK